LANLDSNDTIYLNVFAMNYRVYLEDENASDCFIFHLTSIKKKLMFSIRKNFNAMLT